MKDIIIEVVKFISISLFCSILLLALVSLFSAPAIAFRYAVTHLSEHALLNLVDHVRAATIATALVFIARISIEAITDI